MKSCPHASEVDAQPSLLFGQAAQAIYNMPPHALDIAEGLKDTSRAHYTNIGMSGHLPDKARYLENRGPWNALLAPIMHGIEVEIAKEMVPFIQAGARRWNVHEGVFWQPALAAYSKSDTFDEYFYQSYEGLSLGAMRTMTGWAATVAEWFLEDMRTDPAHWCRPIFDAFSTLHPQFCQAESIQKDFQRKTDPSEAIMEVVVDSNETAHAVIRPFLDHYAAISNKKQLLIAKNEELGQTASVTGEYLGRYLGRAWQSPIGNPFVSLDELIAHQSIWRLASLKNGPWPVPRYCPANVRLRSPVHDARTVVDVLTKNVEYREKRERGTASAAELRLNMLSRVVGDMLLANEN